MNNDTISRQAAIDAIEHRLAEPAYQHTGEDWYVGMNCAESELYDLPSAQPEPIWGLPVSADRPLADVEIVPRLRDIQKQIPGGSYVIDRAIEIIEAVAERRTDERTD